MKRIFSFTFLLFVFFSVQAQQSNLEQARANYKSATTNEQVCRKMVQLLESKTDTQPILLAYLGGYQSLMAKHSKGVFEKMKWFKNGKKNIEAAVEKDNSNPEIRFIRLSIQKNAPKFF